MRLYHIFLFLTLIASQNVYMLEYFIHGKSKVCELETPEQALDLALDIGIITIVLSSLTALTTLNPLTSFVLLAMSHLLDIIQVIEILDHLQNKVMIIAVFIQLGTFLLSYFLVYQSKLLFLATKFLMKMTAQQGRIVSQLPDGVLVLTSPEPAEDENKEDTMKGNEQELPADCGGESK